MSLEEQIAQIVEPNLFTRLCNTLFAAEHGHNYQVIDGTRGDDGNDGWVKSENRILAIHCPVKPDRKTEAGYRAKAFADLKKAETLRAEGGISVERWTFVTPRKLPNDVIVDIAKKGEELGIDANHIEATHLAVLLLKHPELTKEFPELHVSQLEELLLRALESTPNTMKAAPQAPEDEIHHFLDVKVHASEDAAMKEVLELRESPDVSKAKQKLRAIFYKSSEPRVQLNAVLALVDQFAPLDDDAKELANLCETAVGAARRLGSRSVEAFLLAQRGYLLSFEFGKLDLLWRGEVMADAAIGLQLISPERKAAVGRQLQQLSMAFTDAFKSALRLGKESGSPLAMAAILLSIGNAAGQRALYLSKVGDRGDADAERDVCRKAILSARDLYATLGRDREVANAQMNLANQIRFLGEEAEALELVSAVIPIAAKHGDDDLLQKAMWLKESLETGKIPDYLAGERRERK